MVPYTYNLYKDYELTSPIDTQSLGYLMKRTVLRSTDSGCDAPFNELVWTLIFISMFATSFSLYCIAKMRFVPSKVIIIIS